HSIPPDPKRPWGSAKHCLPFTPPSTAMSTKFPPACILFVSVCLASSGHAQPAPEAPPPDEEVPTEKGDLEGEGDEVAPPDEDEIAPGEEGEGDPQQPSEPAPPAGSAPPEIPEDEFFEEEEAAPSRPPPAGKGVVWGVVTDSNGEPVLEGPVKVVGTEQQVVTDFDGQYRLELSPGSHSLRFFYEFHQPMRIDVTVEEGNVNQVDAALSADEEAPVEEFVVEAK